MAKTPGVTNAEIIALQKSSDDVLMELMDFAGRIQNGHVERIENPEEYARHFALVARSASAMVVAILGANAIQKQRDELKRLQTTAEHPR